MLRLFVVLALLISPGAIAQQITTAPRNPTICANGVSAGNTAALNTEEVIRTCTLPAGLLLNIGDSVQLTAGGVFGGTTDSKTLQIRFNGIGAGTVIMSTMAASTAGQTRWWAQVTITKSASNAQSWAALGTVLNGTIGGTNGGAMTVTDTNAIDIVITGKNATTGVANSVTVQTMLATFSPAP